MATGIYFDHSSLYANTGINPATNLFQVNVPTDIEIKLLNSSDADRVVDVLLWFSGPCVGASGGHLDLLPLISPQGTITVTVAKKSGNTHGTNPRKVVQWTPTAGVFPTSLGERVHGCLFGQALVKPTSGPGALPGDESARGNWNAGYELCAQHNIDVITMPARRSKLSVSGGGVSPIQYAFAVGHGLRKPEASVVRLERLGLDDPAIARYLKRFGEATPLSRPGRVLEARDAGLTPGIERLRVPQLKSHSASARGVWFGYAGLLQGSLAGDLSAGRRGKTMKMELAPGETRQGIIDITPPSDAKRGDRFAVGIVHETVAGTSGTLGQRWPRKILGTLALVVVMV